MNGAVPLLTALLAAAGMHGARVRERPQATLTPTTRHATLPTHAHGTRAITSELTSSRTRLTRVSPCTLRHPCPPARRPAHSILCTQAACPIPCFDRRSAGRSISFGPTSSGCMSSGSITVFGGHQNARARVSVVTTQPCARPLPATQPARHQPTRQPAVASICLPAS